MQIVDLSLKINRHMIGIPKLHHYAENPTRCVVLSACRKSSSKVSGRAGWKRRTSRKSDTQC